MVLFVIKVIQRLRDGGLESQWHHPAVPEIDSMTTTSAVLAPYNLRDSNVGNGHTPGGTIAGDKSIQNTRLWCSKADDRGSIYAQTGPLD